MYGHTRQDQDKYATSMRKQATGNQCLIRSCLHNWVGVYVSGTPITPVLSQWTNETSASEIVQSLPHVPHQAWCLTWQIEGVEEAPQGWCSPSLQLFMRIPQKTQVDAPQNLAPQASSVETPQRILTMYILSYSCTNHSVHHDAYVYRLLIAHQTITA